MPTHHLSQQKRSKPYVFIIDDDPVVTYLLIDLVDSVQIPYQVFESPVAFLEQDLSKRQGCIISDLRMPGMSGLELQERLNAENIDLPIIFVSAYAEVQTVVKAMRAGALDFFQKPFSSHEILDRIQEGIRISQSKAEQRAKNTDLSNKMALLTPRERDVLQGIFDGKITKVIAQELGIGVRTTETYRQMIMQKLEADSIAALVRLVFEASLIHRPTELNS